MLLGDAAGLVDPFTGEGIGNVMVAAKYAARVAKKAHHLGEFNAKIFKEYDELVWKNLVGNLYKRKTSKIGSIQFLAKLCN